MPPLRKHDLEEENQEKLEEGTEVLTLSEDGKTAEVKKEDEVIAPKGGDEDDDISGEDDRLAADAERHGRTPEERKARSEARKAAKAHKREQEAAIRAENAELKRQLASLAGEVGTVKQAIQGQNTAIVDQRIAEAIRVRDMAEETIEAAITKQDGKAAREAIKTRDMAVQALMQLNAYKQQAEHAARQQPNNSGEPQVNTDALNRLSGQFLKDNPWIDLNSNDDDMLIVKRLDSSVANAGYKPDTPEYWEELQDRIDRKFPDRLAEVAGDDNKNGARANAQTRPPRRGPGMVGGRSNGNVLGERDVAIPRAVREAWEQAGMWKDPATRADMIKRYKEAQTKYAR